VLEGGRIAMAAMGVGIAEAALGQSVKYMNQRTAFGRTLAEFNGLQGMITEVAAEVEVARLLTLRAAYLKDTGRPARHAAAMAKLFASETAMKAASKAVQIHGGAGYITEFPVERIFRDAKLTEIGEGTCEIQRLVIAREVLQLSCPRPDRVPGAGPLALAHGARERGVRPRARGLCGGAPALDRDGAPRPARPQGLRGEVPTRALRGHEAARRDRPRARHRRQDPPDGRAVRCPRRADARAHGRMAPRHLAPDTQDRDLRDA